LQDSKANKFQTEASSAPGDMANVAAAHALLRQAPQHHQRGPACDGAEPSSLADWFALQSQFPLNSVVNDRAPIVGLLVLILF